MPRHTYIDLTKPEPEKWIFCEKAPWENKQVSVAVACINCPRQSKCKAFREWERNNGDQS